MGSLALDGREHWRHLANTVEQLCAAACGPANSVGDVVYSKVGPTLGNFVINTRRHFIGVILSSLLLILLSCFM